MKRSTASPMSLDVDDAVPADLPRLFELLREQFDDHGIALPPDTLARAVTGLVGRPDRGRVLVARAGDRIVAVAVVPFVWTLEHGGQSAWLDELYVEPAARRRGVGTRLVEATMRAAETAGCLALDLEVDEGHQAATRLYAGMGFRRHRRERWVMPLATTTADAPRRPFASVDHVSLGVNDLTRSKAFYDAALAPLGLVPHQQIRSEIGYGPPGEPPPEGFAFYIGFEDPSAKVPVAPSAGFHVAFVAATRAAVRCCYVAALGAGGRDAGAPGVRPHYHADYYGAFVLDPDGHHVEAVCHAPENTAGA